MVMLGWLRNSLAAVFSWCVNNVGCFSLYLFLMASALRRSRNSGLTEITLLSRSFKMFCYKISISVFLLMLVYPWNKWQLGPKLRKSFCCGVKLQSKRLINLSILLGIIFYRNQMHYNYKSDEKILKTLIHKNILPTDPNKKIKLVIYCNKFKTSNLVIRNNSSPSIGVLQKTNVIYKFKCPLGDCISDNNNIYVGLTSTTLSRRLTMHLSDTSSIAQHLKKHSCPTAQLRKILTDNTTILEHQNNKQKLQILEALHIRNLQPTLNRINFQTSANVLKCL